MAARRTIPIIIVTLLAITILSGCGFKFPDMGTPSIPEATNIWENDSDVLRSTMVADINTIASQNKVKPELSDDFVQKYLGIKDLSVFAKRITDGIAITEANYNLAANEAALWKEIIAHTDFPHYTTADIERRTQEYYDILNQIAASKHQTLDQFLAESPFNMSLNEADAFLKEQAEKYYVLEDQYKNASQKKDSFSLPAPSMSTGENVPIRSGSNKSAVISQSEARTEN